MIRTKRLLAIFLSVLTVASIMIIPANAATVQTVTWEQNMLGFPIIYHGSTLNGYIKFMQRFLLTYSFDAAKEITNAGGVDGGFGLGTEAAVEIFQGDTQGVQNADGIVGPVTWSKVVLYLYKDNAYLKSRASYGYGGEVVVMYQSGSTVNMYTFDTDGNRFGERFHSIT